MALGSWSSHTYPEPSFLLRLAAGGLRALSALPARAGVWAAGAEARQQLVELPSHPRGLWEEFFLLCSAEDLDPGPFLRLVIDTPGDLSTSSASPRLCSSHP